MKKKKTIGLELVCILCIWGFFFSLSYDVLRGVSCVFSLARFLVQSFRCIRAAPQWNAYANIQLVFPNALCYPLNAFNTFTLSFHFKWKLFNENRLNQNGYGGIGENTKSHGHEKCRRVVWCGMMCVCFFFRCVEPVDHSSVYLWWISLNKHSMDGQDSSENKEMNESNE